VISLENVYLQNGCGDDDADNNSEIGRYKESVFFLEKKHFFYKLLKKLHM
jgi:hypothetical protein